MTRSQTLTHTTGLIAQWPLWRFRPLIGAAIPQLVLGRFCSQCAVLLRSGRSVSESIGRAADETDPELERIVRTIVPAIDDGKMLSAALIPYRSRLPAIFLPVIEAGESSGSIDSSFNRLAEAFGSQSSFEMVYRIKVFNPRAIAATLIPIFILFTFVSGSSIAASVEVLVKMAFAFGLVWLMVRLVFPMLNQWTGGRLVFDKIKLALPYLSTVTRNAAGVRWARSFSVLYYAGVPISEALEISSCSALNIYYERALNQAALDTRAGMKLADSLTSVELLPAHLLSSIAAGEESGKLETSLDHLVAALESDALHKGVQSLIAASNSLYILYVLLVIAALFAMFSR